MYLTEAKLILTKIKYLKNKHNNRFMKLAFKTKFAKHFLLPILYSTSLHEYFRKNYRQLSVKR